MRENELPELKNLEKEIIPCDVPVEWNGNVTNEIRTEIWCNQGGPDTSAGKVNILLQAHISRAYIEDFALVSDTAYAAQVSSSHMSA